MTPKKQRNHVIGSVNKIEYTPLSSDNYSKSQCSKRKQEQLSKVNEMSEKLLKFYKEKRK